ncbi:MAG: Uma2 family endonuclease, partial [Chloroflexota bacterium]
QQSVGTLFFDLQFWNRQRRAGTVLIAPYSIRLWPGKIREPDVMFYFAEHLDRLEQQRGGPPDWAAEVLSPSTRRTDLREKLAEYARAGVREYWIVDPEARWIEVYALEGEQYRQAGRYEAGQEAVSELLPGFTVNVADLFGGGTAEGQEAAPR